MSRTLEEGLVDHTPLFFFFPLLLPFLFVCALTPSLASLYCIIFASSMPPIFHCYLIPKRLILVVFFPSLLSFLSPPSPPPPSPLNPAAPSVRLSGRPAADAAPEAQAGCVQRHARADCQIQHGLHGQGGKVSHCVCLLELFPRGCQSGATKKVKVISVNKRWFFLFFYCICLTLDAGPHSPQSGLAYIYFLVWAPLCQSNAFSFRWVKLSRSREQQGFLND